MRHSFKTHPEDLSDLLYRAEKGLLQLPDFQRGWVWDDERISNLLASVSKSYPIGAIMTLEAGSVGFHARPLQGVELRNPASEPTHLLLDGQQRLTSLFLALKSKDPVPTGDDGPNWYYASINASTHHDRNWEDNVVVSVPEDRRIRKDFGRRIVMDLRTTEDEVRNGMFPLNIVFDQTATAKWQEAFVKQCVDPHRDIFGEWAKIRTSILTPFQKYEVPEIVLSRETPIQAVCQVFEHVNTGGVSLTVFELLTATYASQSFRLREDWDTRCEQISRLRPVDELRPIDFLQVVTLLSTFRRNRAYFMENPNGDRPPAVACKRRDILHLPLDEYKECATKAMKGIELAAEFLGREYVFQHRDIPYPSQVIPLSAILGFLGEYPEIMAEGQLRQWYWCGVFGGMYSSGTETRFANDLPECLEWIDNGSEVPGTVRDAQFQAERLIRLRTRNSAAYKGLHALLLKNGTTDFRSGDKIDRNVYFDNAIDIHHIFPSSWCRKNNVDRGLANCIVNKTAISRRTNRKIGGRAPATYLRGIERDSVSETDLNQRLVTHGICPRALRDNNFGAFFHGRFEWLVKQIEKAMDKRVNRSPGDNPFSE